MRHCLITLCLLGFVGTAVAQEKDVTTVKTTTTTIKSSEYDLTTDLWQFADAVTVAPQRIDLRLSYKWVTAGAPANRGDSSDDHILIPKIVWGAAEKLELSLDIPSWVGKGGEKPNDGDGNYDSNIGLLWRFKDQDGAWSPAMALGVSGRFPTGRHSSGIDGTATLVLTNEYDGGLRSHFNLWGKTANGNNNDGFEEDGRVYGSERDFQYGAVVGLDGPLSDAVRWVVDYQWRIGQYDGTGSGSNILEFGLEWQLDDCNRVGMSNQLGLDDNDDTPNYGAIFNFSHSIMY